MLSPASTVTVASHEEVFPPLSTTVKTTILTPMWLSLNSLWLIDSSTSSPHSSKLSFPIYLRY